MITERLWGRFAQVLKWETEPGILKCGVATPMASLGNFLTVAAELWCRGVAGVSSRFEESSFEYYTFCSVMAQVV